MSSAAINAVCCRRNFANNRLMHLSTVLASLEAWHCICCEEINLLFSLKQFVLSHKVALPLIFSHFIDLRNYGFNLADPDNGPPLTPCHSAKWRASTLQQNRMRTLFACCSLPPLRPPTKSYFPYRQNMDSKVQLDEVCMDGGGRGWLHGWNGSKASLNVYTIKVDLGTSLILSKGW